MKDDLAILAIAAAINDEKPGLVFLYHHCFAINPAAHLYSGQQATKDELFLVPTVTASSLTSIVC